MPKRFKRQKKKYKRPPFKGKKTFIGSCLSGQKYSQESDFDATKPSVYGTASLILVKKEDKQPMQFEVRGVLQSCTNSFCFVNGFKFFKGELFALGYGLKSGSYISVLAERHKDKPSFLKPIERLDKDLRSLSDMRNKPAWQRLPWLEPSIEAIYAERDEVSRRTGIPHEVDHIDPVCHSRLCGLTVPWNLQVIPAVENRRKGNRLLC